MSFTRWRLRWSQAGCTTPLWSSFFEDQPFSSISLTRVSLATALWCVASWAFNLRVGWLQVTSGVPAWLDVTLDLLPSAAVKNSCLHISELILTVFPLYQFCELFTGGLLSQTSVPLILYSSCSQHSRTKTNKRADCNPDCIFLCSDSFQRWEMKI